MLNVSASHDGRFPALSRSDERITLLGKESKKTDRDDRDVHPLEVALRSDLLSRIKKYNIFVLTRLAIFSDPDSFTSNLNRAREFPPSDFFARSRAAIPTNQRPGEERRSLRLSRFNSQIHIGSARRTTAEELPEGNTDPHRQPERACIAHPESERQAIISKTVMM